MRTLATYIQHSTRSLSHSSKTRKIKSVRIGKEEVELSKLFTGDMIVCIENPKDSPKMLKILSQLINEFSNVVAYRTDRHLVQIHTDQRKREIKKIPVAVASKSARYQGINLFKKVKDLYSEGGKKRNRKKTLRKEMENDTNKWKKYTMFVYWKN